MSIPEGFFDDDVAQPAQVRLPKPAGRKKVWEAKHGTEVPYPGEASPDVQALWTEVMDAWKASEKAWREAHPEEARKEEEALAEKRAKEAAKKKATPPKAKKAKMSNGNSELSKFEAAYVVLAGELAEANAQQGEAWQAFYDALQ